MGGSLKFVFKPEMTWKCWLVAVLREGDVQAAKHVRPSKTLPQMLGDLIESHCVNCVEPSGFCYGAHQVRRLYRPSGSDWAIMLFACVSLLL